MRKDMLLKDWCKKVKYVDEYEIKVGFMLTCSCGRNGVDEWVLECFADLYIDGEIEVMEAIDFIESNDEIEKIPANMKRKAKAFFEYFQACDVFQDVISYNDKLITV